MKWYPVPASVARRHLLQQVPYTDSVSEFVAMAEFGFMATAGELDFWTERRLADRWHWSRGKVRRLMNDYQDETKKDSGPRSIQNRSKKRPRTDQEKTTIDPRTDQERSKKDPRRSLARAINSSYRSTGTEEHIQVQLQVQKEDPPTPRGVETSSEEKSKTSRRKNIPPEPEQVPTCLSGREDAQMWLELIPKLKPKEQDGLPGVVALWDTYRQSFPRAKVIQVEDIRAMVAVQATPYTADDLEAAIKGIVMMGSEPKGQWVYSSGSHTPRKFFANMSLIQRAIDTYERQERVQKGTDPRYYEGLQRTPEYTPTGRLNGPSMTEEDYYQALGWRPEGSAKNG